MTSMNVPEPVMSLAVMPKSRDSTGNFSKALSRCAKSRRPSRGRRASRTPAPAVVCFHHLQLSTAGIPQLRRPPGCSRSLFRTPAEPQCRTGARSQIVGQMLKALCTLIFKGAATCMS